MWPPGSQGTRAPHPAHPCPGLPSTCHNGLPVPFPIRPDPDELLPQEGGHICVAVHKYPDRVLQRDRSQIFDLPGTKIGMLISLPRGKLCLPQATPSGPARGPLHCLLHSPCREETPRPTSSVIVAEKSIVWRWWEHIRMISFICSSKYSSSILASRGGKESRERPKLTCHSEGQKTSGWQWFDVIG